MLAELAVAAGDTARAERFRADVAGLTLTDDERAAVAAELRAGTELQRWLSDSR
ncbi:glyoxalase, partial [Nocardia elegans]|nr:glyoxalase [Nocardia elegans]